MSMRFYATFTILLGLVPAVEANEKLIRKTYPVADLVVPIEGAPGCNLGKPSASPCTKDTANALPHSLIELITKTVDPTSWADSDGSGTIFYFPIGMGLVVNQKAEVHEKLQAMLESLRKLQDVQMTVDLRVVSVYEGFLEQTNFDCRTLQTPQTIHERDTDDFERIGIDFAAKSKPIFFNDKQLKIFFEVAQGDRRTEILSVPNITMSNGRSAAVQVGERQDRLIEVIVQDKIGQKLFLAAHAPDLQGSVVKLTGVVSADRQSVVMNVAGELARVDGPPQLVPVVDASPTAYVLKANIGKLAIAEQTASIPIGKTLAINVGKMTRVDRTETGPPELSEIPYLNQLFKKVGYSRSNTQILLLVTPRLVNSTVAEQPQGGACLGQSVTALIGSAKGCCNSSVPAVSCIAGVDAVKAECGTTACTSSDRAKTATPPMNLADVSALVSCGVSDEIILNQIHTTAAVFVLATEDILFLKKNKVSDRVVIEMQNSQQRHQMMAQPMPYPPGMVYPLPMQPIAPHQYWPHYGPPLPTTTTRWNVPMPVVQDTSYFPTPMPSASPVATEAPATRQTKSEAAAEVGEFFIEAAVDFVETLGGMFSGRANVSLPLEPRERMLKLLDDSEELPVPTSRIFKRESSKPSR